MAEIRRLGFVGHSAKLTLPPFYLKDLGWKDGDMITITRVNNQLLLERQENGGGKDGPKLSQ